LTRLARNILANLLSNAWATVLALLVTPVYVRLLGVESYGLIGFYTSWIAVLGILDTGISATAMRELAWLDARPPDRGRIPSLLRSLEIVYWAAILFIGALMLAGAAGFGANWFDARQLPPDVVRRALVLMVFSLVLQVPSGLYVAGLMGLQRQVECATLIVLCGTVRAAGAVIVLLAHPTIEAFFTWQIFVSLLQTGTMRWSLWKKVDGNGDARFSRAALSSVGGFAGRMTLLTALSVVLTQGDKMILSRLIPLNDFGLYMLAWTVASGLSRVSTPLIQAFSPRFTELVSRDAQADLSRQVRMASRLMSTLILPPAALLALLARPILLLWTRDPSVADHAAQILPVLVIGTAMSASSYPALSVLYSQGRLKPVLIVNVIAVLILLPALFIAVPVFGARGAALCWLAYGVTVYVAYHIASLATLPNVDRLSAALRDVVLPGGSSVAVALVASYWSTQADNAAYMPHVLVAGLLSGWAVALFLSGDAGPILRGALRWNTIAIR
jgi:O-antigen/teichoic acid export membrane protein